MAEQAGRCSLASAKIQREWEPRELQSIDEVGVIFQTTSGEANEYHRPVVRSATLEKIILLLTRTKYNDIQFNKTILLTFPEFTTASEFLILLIERFNNTPIGYPEIEQEEQKLKTKIIRFRVFNILKQWMQTCPHDMLKPGVKKLLENFLNSLLATENMQTAQTLILLLEQKANPKSISPFIMAVPPPKPLLLTLGKPKDIFYLNYHPVEVARQLSMIEFGIFAKISPSEFLNRNWQVSQSRELAPNISILIRRYTLMSSWVLTNLHKCKSKFQLREVFNYFIDIANACKNYNNFNSIPPIVKALNSFFQNENISNILSKNYKVNYDMLKEPISENQKFRSFRAIKAANAGIDADELVPPCIPYLEIYLRDLTFLVESQTEITAPNNIQCTGESLGFINVAKLTSIANVISEVQSYQQTPYHFEIVAKVAAFLHNSALEQFLD